MIWLKELLLWVLAIYLALYDLIARAFRTAIAIFKAPQSGPLLPIAMTPDSFNNEFNPFEDGLRTCFGC
jgi:hypothetical protein